MNPTSNGDLDSIAEINARVPGWSDERQYGFFKKLFAENPGIYDMLMLGVYHGRDLCYIVDILRRYHAGRTMRIIGADRFTAERCADWPRWVETWEELTHGMPPPNLRAAEKNIDSDYVELFMRDDVDFLESLARQKSKFDCIYVDTSHDYKSVRAVLQLVPSVGKAGAIICGDDYVEANGWGVVRAVNESFCNITLHAGHIWVTTVEDAAP